MAEYCIHIALGRRCCYTGSGPTHEPLSLEVGTHTWYGDIKTWMESADGIVLVMDNERLGYEFFLSHSYKDQLT